MRGIGIQPRVPEQRNRELWQGDWDREATHSGAQVSGMPFGNAGDQIGGPSPSQRGRKAADDRDDPPFQPERLHGFVDWSRVEALTRHDDVPPRRLTGGRDVTRHQPVPESTDANDDIPDTGLTKPTTKEMKP